jgi:hypothetical protein
MALPAAESPTPMPASTRPRGRGFWAGQLLPPLVMLLPLLSSDSTTVQFSIAMLLPVVLLCVLSLLLRGAFALFRRGDPRRMLRPALAIALYVPAAAYLLQSRDEARAVAAALATQLQAACVRDDACPAALAAGEGDDPSRRDLATPSTHLRWDVRYLRTADGFELHLLEMMDVSRVWRGGPGVALTAEEIADGVARPIGPDGEAIWAEDDPRADD